MGDRKVILTPTTGASGRSDRKGQIERPHRLGSAARPRRTEPTPGRRGLVVLALGEVRAGPGGGDRAGWGSQEVAAAVTLTPKQCGSAEDPRASLGERGLTAAFQLLDGAALQPGRALPS